MSKAAEAKLLSAPHAASSRRVSGSTKFGLPTRGNGKGSPCLRWAERQRLSNSGHASSAKQEVVRVIWAEPPHWKKKLRWPQEAESLPPCCHHPCPSSFSSACQLAHHQNLHLHHLLLCPCPSGLASPERTIAPASRSVIVPSND